jgi:hypothetical protein
LVDGAGEEIMDYILRNFSRDKHERYFTSRIGVIKAGFNTMTSELDKMACYADRVE